MQEGWLIRVKHTRIIEEHTKGYLTTKSTKDTKKRILLKSLTGEKESKNVRSAFLYFFVLFVSFVVRTMD